MLKLIAGGICLAVFVGLAAMILAHNLRIRRARRTLHRIPDDVQRQVLDLIREAASHVPHVVFWRRGASMSRTPEDWIDQSHLGGTPYAEGTESWPEAREPRDGPPRFLMQLRLTGTGLNEAWRDRLIVVYLQFDYEQVVRSYAQPSRSKHVALDMPDSPLQFVETAIAVDSGKSPGGFGG